MHKHAQQCDNDHKSLQNEIDDKSKPYAWWHINKPLLKRLWAVDYVNTTIKKDARDLCTIKAAWSSLYLDNILLTVDLNKYVEYRINKYPIL